MKYAILLSEAELDCIVRLCKQAVVSEKEKDQDRKPKFLPRPIASRFWRPIWIQRSDDRRRFGRVPPGEPRPGLRRRTWRYVE